MNESTIKKKTSKSKSNQSLVERVEFRYGVKRGEMAEEYSKGCSFLWVGLIEMGSVEVYPTSQGLCSSSDVYPSSRV